MKKGQVWEGIVKEVDFPNKGKVFLPEEDRTVIVKNTVPGQKIRFSVNKIRKGKAEGRLLEVLKPSEKEIPSVCPHFGQCGGCTYQNLPYEEQLAMKESQIKKMMDEAVNGKYVWEGVKPSPVKQAYRNKMEFSFGDEYKDGPIALGMHKRGSFHDIVNVTDCQIVDEDYRKILDCTLEAARESGLLYYHRMRHTGYFRHLLVRKAVKTEEILVDLVTTTETDAQAFLDTWVKKLLELELDVDLLLFQISFNQLLCQQHIVFRSTAICIVEDSRLSESGSFCQFRIPVDQCLEHHILKILSHLFNHLIRQPQPGIVHRQHKSLDLQIGIQPFLNQFYRTQQFSKSFQSKILTLHRNNHRVGSCQ